MARCGGPGGDNTHHNLGWVDRISSVSTSGIKYMSTSKYLDATAFGDMVGYGFFFITIVLLISIMFGERAPMQVRATTTASKH